MTVRELIAELLDFDMDASVRIRINSDKEYESTEVEEVQDFMNYDQIGNRVFIETTTDYVLVDETHYEELLQIKEDPTA
ncbi:hypothetical protein [Geomicrobium sp. JCM 19055]|uniref:hypothetical protein n=1 Tax=Geomicrobium sp. JCM 19055 TaxID=1460649 RepID=UPI0005A9AEAB|nr:hypothetical protein [Geomicrobium sp. JCM 19055]